ncbi:MULTISPECIES: hypothetical protein [unclassified Agrococcus]|uniref:hypothetical protein n=1 Tax=unclassified Agrococcus TaxID=2615065 RepID=UPI00361A39E5
MPERAGARIGAATWLLGATVVAGGLGYVSQLLAARLLPPDGYESFTVWWSLLYFVVAAVAGVQHEIARASGPAAPGGRGRSVLAAVLVVGAVAIVAIAVAALLAGGEPAIAAALALGIGGYVLLAAVSGLLYGAEAWRLVATTMVVDAATRAVLTTLALALGAPMPVVVLAFAAPFLVTVVVTLVPVRRAIASVGVVASPRALLATIAVTVGGSAATALLVSGFPFALRVLSPEVPDEEFGAFSFSFTLARAPLVVAVMALQTFLVTRFRAQGRPLALLGRIAVVVAVVSAALAALAWWLGPVALAAFFDRGYGMPGAVLAGIVGSAGSIALLTVSGAMVLARASHGAYLGGWAVAAITTIALLLVPGDLATRAVVAVGVGPALGVAVHVAGLVRASGRLADDDRTPQAPVVDGV